MRFYSKDAQAEKLKMSRYSYDLSVGEHDFGLFANCVVQSFLPCMS